jgi:acetyl esterase/lipase
MKSFRSFLFRPAFSSVAVLVGLTVFVAQPVQGAEPKVISGIAYRGSAESGAEINKQCQLDLYLPVDGKIEASLLWLHGGGLTGGNRDSAATQRIARRFADAGIAVASADYRLNPVVTFPVYVDDAAAAYAWLQENIGAHGGDSRQVFIGGHSAGAYLALMVALDERYLRECGVDLASLAGVVAISGQTTTHFTVRAERDVPAERMIIDDAAPLFHVRKREFPFLILYAGRDMALRVEENRLLAGALRHAGSTQVEDELFEDRDHSTIITKMGEAEDTVASRIVTFITLNARTRGNSR